MVTLSGSPRIVPDPVINTAESKVKLTEAPTSLKAPLGPSGCARCGTAGELFGFVEVIYFQVRSQYQITNNT